MANVRDLIDLMRGDPDNFKKVMRTRGWKDIPAHEELGPATPEMAKAELDSLGFEHQVTIPVERIADTIKTIVDSDRKWKDWTTRGIGDTRNGLITRHTVFAFSDLNDGVFFQLLR